MILSGWPEPAALRVLAEENDRRRERSGDTGLLDRELDHRRLACTHDRRHCTCGNGECALGHVDTDECRQGHDDNGGGQPEKLRDT